MNATEMIAKAASRAGFQEFQCHTTEHTMTVSYAGDRDILHVQYRMFGTPNNYMCRWYGYDDNRGINWGVERAWVKTHTALASSPSLCASAWLLTKMFDGKEKKRQIVAWLREHE